MKIKSKMDKRKLVKINGFDGFKCIGGQCIDNCCHGASWRIDIENKLYDKYKLLDNEIGKKIISNLGKNEATDMYQIKLNKENLCPFNDEDKLCGIYKELGEEYMGIVCRVYPRLIHRYNYSYEYSLSISCPVAVENLVMNENPISFSNEYVKKSEMPHKLTPLNTPIKTGITGENCIKIRDFSILILQQRSLSLWQRIAYLGIFSKGIDNIQAQNNISKEIDNTIIKYSDNLYSEEIVASLFNMKFNKSSIRNNLMMELTELLPIIFSKLELRASDNTEFCTKVLDVFVNISAPIPKYLTPDTIGKLKSDLLNPYIIEKEFVFENYLVIEMFNFQYPSHQSSVYNAFSALVVKYILLQLFIIMVCYDKDILTNNDIVNCIYFFSKHIDHNINKQILMEYLAKESPALSLANLVSIVMY